MSGVVAWWRRMLHTAPLSASGEPTTVGASGVERDNAMDSPGSMTGTPSTPTQTLDPLLLSRALSAASVVNVSYADALAVAREYERLAVMKAAQA